MFRTERVIGGGWGGGVEYKIGGGELKWEGGVISEIYGAALHEMHASCN